MKIELVEDPGDVFADCRFAHRELVGDVAVRSALCNEFEDVELDFVELRELV